MDFRTIQLAGLVLLAACATDEPLNRNQSAAHGDIEGNDVVSILERVSATPDFSGAIALRQHGRLIFSSAKGFANEDTTRKNTASTRFGAASTSKLITAAVVQDALIANGFKIDTPIATYFTEAEGFGFSNRVTAANLLNHHTSTTEFWEVENADARVLAAKSNSDFYDLAVEAQTQPIDVISSEKATYNNTGFIIAGEIVERVSGIDFETYVQRFLTERGINSVLFSRASEADLYGLSIGYVLIEDSETQSLARSNDPFSNAVSNAAGGLYLTADDLARTMTYLSDDHDSQLPLYRQLCVPEFQTGPDRFYGYGCSLVMRGGDIVRFGHSGGAPGISAVAVHYPEYGLSVAILSNRDGGTLRAIKQLDALLLPEAD